MTIDSKGATCVIEQLWPGITVDLAFAQLEQISREASILPRTARPRLLGATLILEDDTLFTWCVAPSIESLRTLLVTSGVRFDRVLRVVHTKRRPGASSIREVTFTSP